MSKILQQHGVTSIYLDNMDTVCRLMKTDFDELKKRGDIKNDDDFESVYATVMDTVKQYLKKSE